MFKQLCASFVFLGILSYALFLVLLPLLSTSRIQEKADKSIIEIERRGLTIDSGTSTTFGDINLGTSSGGVLFNGLVSNSFIANTVTILGDINADGFDDIMVATTNKLYVIYGSRSSSNANLESFTSSQGFTIAGYFPTNTVNAKYIAMSGLGDINNDGYDDMIFGSWDKSTEVATFYVLYGAKSFTNIDTSDASSFAYTFTISDIFIFYKNSAISVSKAGDFNGDGYGDIIVGIASYDSDGVTYIIYGGPTLSSLAIPYSNANQGIIVNGTHVGDYYSASGFAVCGIGDFNGDGYDDVVIGAPITKNKAGIVYVIYGSSDAVDISLADLPISMGFTMYGSGEESDANPYGSLAGWSVSAGDFNHDGLADIVIGSPAANANTGLAYVIYGTRSITGDMDLDTIDISRGVQIFGINPADYLGYSVSGGSDVNGDGIDDIVIGATGANNGLGGAYVIYGATSQPSIHLASLSSSVGYAIIGDDAYGHTGFSVSCSGDVNHDGYGDIVTGAPFFKNINGETVLGNVGTGYTVFGQPTGQSIFTLSSISSINRLLSTDSDEVRTVQIAVSIPGDINNDNYLDVLVGEMSSYYNEADVIYVMYGGVDGFRSIPGTHQMLLYQGFNITGSDVDDYMGFAVSGAGDVNGDGIPDFIFGAPCFYCQNYTGYAYIIFGTTLPDRPSLELQTMTEQDGIKISGKYLEDGFGSSVRNAGDFDGDGYDDVIIGAPYANNTGECYIIYGSSSISDINVLDSSHNTVTIFGAGFGDTTGYAVSSAGDFNGDGYDDIIIGAYYDFTIGAVYIVYGTPHRKDIYLNSITKSGAGIIILGTSNPNNVAFSLSSAYDVNGDGYADVVVGSVSAYDDAGAAYVIYGSRNPTNFMLTTIAGSGRGFIIHGAVADDKAGNSVSSAGDVNADGFPDIIIGASNQGSSVSGSSYIVYGGKSSDDVYLANLGTQGFIVAGNVEDERSGYSVACAADKLGNALGVIGTYGSGAFYTLAPTATMPTSLTLEPTAIPTASPTTRPTSLPTKPPPPTFWEENEVIILGVLVPALFSFVPIYFSKEICFYILDNWDSNNYQRGIMRIGAYNVCKRIFLEDYITNKELREKKDEIAEQRNHLLEGSSNAGIINISEEASAGIEMTSISIYADDASSNNDCIINPMLGVHHEIILPNAQEGDHNHPSEQSSVDDRGSFDSEHINIVVNAVYGIRYDNPLLNHPQLVDMLLEAKNSGQMEAVDRLLSSQHQSPPMSNNLQPVNQQPRLTTDDMNMPSIGSKDNEYIMITEPGQPLHHDLQSISMLLNAREIVENIPLVYYLSSRWSTIMQAMHIMPNMTSYEWFVDRKILLASHLGLGTTAAVLLPDYHDKVQAWMTSTVSSVLFGFRLHASQYLNKKRADIISSSHPSSATSWQVAEYCLASTIMHTTPSLAMCQVSSFVYMNINSIPSCSLGDIGLKLALSGGDCYAVYMHVYHNCSISEVLYDHRTPTSMSSILGSMLCFMTIIFMLCRYFGIKLFSRKMIGMIIVVDHMSSLLMTNMPKRLKIA